MNLISIPALQDNYIWTLNDEAGNLPDCPSRRSATGAGEGLRELRARRSRCMNLFKSLIKLPVDTLVRYVHEYTLSNLKFAAAILPHDPKTMAEYQKIKDLRAKNGISLPKKPAHERQINLFLRTQDPDLQTALNINLTAEHVWQPFALLREKKDQF